MELNHLPKTTTVKKKRRGQGYGSGKGGHTTGSGQKGQRTRTSIAQWFEGGQLPQIRRFPFIRGKSRFVSLTPKPVEINVSQLNRFPKGSQIDPKTLIESGIIKAKDISYRPVKVLGKGELNVAVNVSLPTSATARKKIEKAGGKVISG
jgi:large subunit ribosomal protein L15